MLEMFAKDSTRRVRQRVKTDFQYQYIPLLENMEEEYPEYIVHLNFDNKALMAAKKRQGNLGLQM